LLPHITGGENVHPIEVETVLESHPSVAEACVVGKPDRDWGQVVTAYVRLRPKMFLAADELQGHARRELSGFKVPRRIVFVDDLPRTGSGKVSRREVGKGIGR
jgi:acyl-CoA synthetase (AMP-forming)/AMP-acid ligase II